MEEKWKKPVKKTVLTEYEEHYKAKSQKEKSRNESHNERPRKYKSARK